MSVLSCVTLGKLLGTLLDFKEASIRSSKDVKFFPERVDSK